jgi:chitodextrinase
VGGETLTDRSRTPLLVALVLIVGLLALSLAATRPAAAPPGYPTVTIEVVRIAEIDPVDLPPTGDWDWYYWLGVWDGTAYNWTWFDAPNGMNVSVARVHVLDAAAASLQFTIILCEGDTFSADDVADISSAIGGGQDDTDCPVGPLVPIGAFQATWNLASDALSGDGVIVDAEGLRASGDLDGSTGVDENDANLWFHISDNYAPPMADAGPDQEGWVNDSFIFDGRGSVGTNASLESYAWDFDGDAAPDATGALVIWRFAAKGAHAVTLTVTDSVGRTDQDASVVTIRNRGPTARFAFLPADPEARQSVLFADTSIDTDGTVASWAWDFGDGGTSADANPSHAFAEPGTYTVRLVVTDDDGGTASVSRTVTVRAATGESPVAWLGLGVLVLLILLAIALLRWWRKSPPPSD